MNHFDNPFHRARIAQGKTLMQLAHDSDLSLETVCRADDGSGRQQARTRQSLSRALQVPEDVLWPKVQT